MSHEFISRFSSMFEPVSSFLVSPRSGLRTHLSEGAEEMNDRAGIWNWSQPENHHLRPLSGRGWVNHPGAFGPLAFCRLESSLLFRAQEFTWNDSGTVFLWQVMVIGNGPNFLCRL
jgi:hypothetical protein